MPKDIDLSGIDFSDLTTPQQQPAASSEIDLSGIDFSDLPTDQAKEETDSWGDVIYKSLSAMPERMQRSWSGLKQAIAPAFNNTDVDAQAESLIAAAQQGVESAQAKLAELGFNPNNMGFVEKGKLRQALAFDNVKDDEDFKAARDEGLRLTAEIAKTAPKTGDQWSAKNLVSAVLTGAQDMAPSVILGLITKSPGVGLAGMSGQAYGTYYQDAIDKGLPPAQANNRASIFAALEPITEALPMGLLLRRGANKLTDLGKSAIAEGLQESVTQAAQDAYDMGVLDEDMTVGQFLNNMAFSGVVGAGVGGTLHAGIHGAGMVREARDSAALGRAQRNAAAESGEAAPTIDPSEYDAVRAEMGVQDPLDNLAEQSSPQISQARRDAYNRARAEGMSPADALNAARGETDGVDLLDSMIADVFDSPDSVYYANRRSVTNPPASVAELVQQQAAQGDVGPLDSEQRALPAPGQTSVIAMPGPVADPRTGTRINDVTDEPAAPVGSPVPAKLDADINAIISESPEILGLPSPGQTSVIAMPGGQTTMDMPQRPTFTPNSTQDERSAPVGQRPVRPPLPGETSAPAQEAPASRALKFRRARPKAEPALTEEDIAEQRAAEDAEKQRAQDMAARYEKVEMARPALPGKDGKLKVPPVRVTKELIDAAKSRGVDKGAKVNWRGKEYTVDAFQGRAVRLMDETGRVEIVDVQEVNAPQQSGESAARSAAWSRTIDNMSEYEIADLADDTGISGPDVRNQLKSLSPDILEESASPKTLLNVENEMEGTQGSRALTADDAIKGGGKITRKGNVRGIEMPDGTFYPSRDIGAAEMNKMLHHEAYAERDASLREMEDSARDKFDQQVTDNTVNSLLRDIDNPRRKLSSIRADMAAMAQQDPNNADMYAPLNGRTRAAMRKELEARRDAETLTLPDGTSMLVTADTDVPGMMKVKTNTGVNGTATESQINRIREALSTEDPANNPEVRRVMAALENQRKYAGMTTEQRRDAIRAENAAAEKQRADERAAREKADANPEGKMVGKSWKDDRGTHTVVSESRSSPGIYRTDTGRVITEDGINQSIREQRAQEQRDESEKGIAEYTRDMPAMKRGNVMKALRVKVRYNGEVKARHQIVEELFAKGATVGTIEGKPAIIHKDGETYLTVTKAEADYLNHLSSPKPAKATPNPRVEAMEAARKGPARAFEQREQNKAESADAASRRAAKEKMEARPVWERVDRFRNDSITAASPHLADLATWTRTYPEGVRKKFSDQMRKAGYQTQPAVDTMLANAVDHMMDGYPLTDFPNFNKLPKFVKDYLRTVESEVAERDAQRQAEKDRKAAEQAEREQAEADPYVGRSYYLPADIRMDVTRKVGKMYEVTPAQNGSPQMITEASVKMRLDAAETPRNSASYAAGAYDRAVAKKGAPSVKSEQGTGKRMTPEQVAKGAAAFVKKYKGALAADITVMDKAADLGINIPDGSVLLGFYDVGGISTKLISENITSQAELEALLRHEVIVHYGLRSRLSKPEYDAEMDKVLAAEKSPALRKFFREARDKYSDFYDLSSPDGQRMIAEEVVARVAEDPKVMDRPGVIRRVIEAIRNLLIKAKILPNSASMESVRDLIRANGEYLANTIVDRNDVRVSLPPMSYNAPKDLSGAMSKKTDIDSADVPDSLKDGMRRTMYRDTRSMTQRIKDMMTDNFSWRGVYQNIFDDMYAIADYEKKTNNGKLKMGRESAYKQSMLAKNINSVVAVAMNKGAPVYNNGHISLNRNTKGFTEVFKPVMALKGNMLPVWEYWAAAVRAKRLKAEGRENLFTDQEIDDIINYVNRRPELRKAFNDAHKDWRTLNKAILDFGEQTGIIDPEARRLFESEDYVPFYRVDEEADRVTAPAGRGGLANQSSGIRRLRGGEGKMDILENMARNINHIISSGVKNAAMQRIRDVAVGAAMEEVPANFRPVDINVKKLKEALNDMGIATSSLTAAQEQEYAKLFAYAAPAGPNVVSIRYDGKPKYYEVTDPLLLRSVTRLGPDNLDAITRVLALPKKLLTRTVTSTPTFVATNLTRDIAGNFVQMANAAGRNSVPKIIGDIITLRPFRKAMVGAKRSFMQDGMVTDFQVSGGMSGGYDQSRPESVAEGLRNLQKRNLIVSGVKGTWELYNKFLTASEQATRMAVYQDVMDHTGDPVEAAYQANDVLNFSRRGSNPLVGFLISTIPFLNARLQGLDRMARGGIESPKAFLIKGMLITAASMALMALNADDEDYWALPEYERDMFWIVPVNGVRYRIPKPFEVGAVFGTIPERIFEETYRGDHVFGDRMGFLLRNTFAVDWPQFIQPYLEDSANMDTFTQRPIVPMSLQRVQPSEQASTSTPDWIKGLAGMMPEGAPEWTRSPLRLQHMVEGYTGSMGQWLISTTDAMYRAAFTDNVNPAKPPMDMPVMRSFVRTGTSANKYVDRLYQMSEEAGKTYGTLKAYKDQNMRKEYREFSVEKRSILASRKQINKAVRQMQDYNKQVKEIYASTTMDAETKRAKLDALTIKKNALAQKISDKYWNLF